MLPINFLKKNDRFPLVSRFRVVFPSQEYNHLLFPSRFSASGRRLRPASFWFSFHFPLFLRCWLHFRDIFLLVLRERERERDTVAIPSTSLRFYNAVECQRISEYVLQFHSTNYALCMNLNRIARSFKWCLDIFALIISSILTFVLYICVLD